MPCYDKKLEASRPDFATMHQPPTFGSATEPVSVRDVDLVLTTGEVAKMISDKGLSLRALAASEGDPDVDGRAEEQYFPFSQLLDPPRGTSSGSYVHAALSSLLSPPTTSRSPADSRAPTISRSDWPFLRLDSKLVRNDDYVEYTLRRVSTPYSPSSSSPDTDSQPGDVLVKAAKCYGFRNLQNVVRKLSREAGISVGRGAAGKSPASSAAAAANARRAAKMAGGGAKEARVVEPVIEFVEVMACPSGCVNGGGQAAPPRESLRTRRRRPSWAGADGKGFVGRVDEEGMPDTVGDVVEAEIKIVANQDAGKGLAGEGTGVGSDEDRVLSAKEWVQEVEKRYWSGATTDNRPRRDDIDIDSIHPSIRPFVLALPSSAEEDALARVLEEMLGSDEGADRDARRKELLRTSYRAVESEEVNALAVTW